MSQHRVVVVGTGNISRLWIDHVRRRPDARVVALVDLQLARAEASRQQFGLDVPVFTDLGEALAAVDATLVFDLTVPAAHLAVTGTAFEHGLDVFSEKPLAASMADARVLVETARRRGLTYSVMQNRRYLPEMQALRDIIASGHIGEVSFVASDFFVGLHHGEYRETMEHPLLLDMSVHTWDQSRFLTGMSPVAVQARSFRPLGSWFAGDTAALVTFEYGSGALYSYRGHYNAEGASTDYQSSWRIVGTRGTACWDGHSAPYAEVPRETDPNQHAWPVERWTPTLDRSGPTQHDGGLEEMFAALEAGRPSATAGSDNIQSLAMLHAIMASLAADGSRVEL